MGLVPTLKLLPEAMLDCNTTPLHPSLTAGAFQCTVVLQLIPGLTVMSAGQQVITGAASSFNSIVCRQNAYFVVSIGSKASQMRINRISPGQAPLNRTESRYLYTGGLHRADPGDMVSCPVIVGSSPSLGQPE